MPVHVRLLLVATPAGDRSYQDIVLQRMCRTNWNHNGCSTPRLDKLCSETAKKRPTLTGCPLEELTRVHPSQPHPNQEGTTVFIVLPVIVLSIGFVKQKR